jgi:uncharacterized protein
MTPVPAGARRLHDNRWTVPVAALLREPGARRQVRISGPFAGLSVTGSRVSETDEVELDAVLESVHGGILVSGTVRAPWAGECRRCLELAGGLLEAEVRELCVAGGDAETTYGLQGDELDLLPIVHDACILALPLAPLCREGCLGLCPECGANRNVERCSCGTVPVPRWAPLAVLEGGASQGGRGRRDPAPPSSGVPSG